MSIYNSGDIVKVMNENKIYSRYRNFMLNALEENPDLFDINNWRACENLDSSKEYEVIYAKNHEDNEDTIVYIIKDLDNDKLFMVGEEGLTLSPQQTTINAINKINSHFEKNNNCSECEYSKQCKIYNDLTEQSICGAMSLIYNIIKDGK